MLTETDFIWHERHVNNIAVNPVHCCYCIVDIGDGTGRMYKIEHLHEQDEHGWNEKSDEYKYYVLFDCSVQLATEGDTEYPYSMALYSGYSIIRETMIAVFDSLEVAKKRAYNQYAHQFGYVLPFIDMDAEEKISKHFVVE